MRRWLIRRKLAALDATWGESFIGKGCSADTVVRVEEQRARLRKKLRRLER